MVKTWKYPGDAAALRYQWVLFDSASIGRCPLSYVVPMNLEEVVTSEDCQGFAVCDTLSRDATGIYAFHMTPFGMSENRELASEYGSSYHQITFTKSSRLQTSPEIIAAGNITLGFVTDEWNIRSVEAGIYEVDAIMPNQGGRRKLGVLPDRRFSVEGWDNWDHAQYGWHIEPQSGFRTRLRLSETSRIAEDKRAAFERGYCLVRRVKRGNEGH